MGVRVDVLRHRGSRAQFNSGWLQAGFSSLAYRLAHLRLPSPAVVLGVSLVFFLI